MGVTVNLYTTVIVRKLIYVCMLVMAESPVNVVLHAFFWANYQQFVLSTCMHILLQCTIL